jgi:hypothetical protein
MKPTEDGERRGKKDRRADDDRRKGERRTDD